MELINGPVLDFGEVVKRPLHFFWLVDCSGSMEGKKIEVLNRAVRESIPEIRSALANHPEVQIFMRSIQFSNVAQWHIGPEPAAIEDFVWTDLEAESLTATASAIRLLTQELSVEKMNKRGFPPVCILLSDGYCTESEEEYSQAIAELNQNPWGKKAVRLVIAIGDNNNYDEHALLQFTNHPEVGVLKADSPEKLVAYIKWASTTASLGSSVTKSNVGAEADRSPVPETQSTNVILGTPPEIEDANDVF